MMQKVLESIYEPLFLDCSYGFRPGRGCHDALKALYQHLYRQEVQIIIDVDLANFSAPSISTVWSSYYARKSVKSG